DEAALYDRQIRLWGLEAQNKLRTSHVLIHSLTGVNTEVIKNIVLSGIGTLSIVDDELIQPEDLGAGFFFREDEVGSERLSQGPISRIQSLNPLVRIRAIKDPTFLLSPSSNSSLEALKEMKLDVIVAGKGTRSQLVELDLVARSLGVKFYTSRSVGLGGYIFSDLGDHHEYLTEKNGQQVTMEKKKIKHKQAFVSLSDSLSHSWKGSMNERKMKRLRLNPLLFGIWAYWEWEARRAIAEAEVVKGGQEKVAGSDIPSELEQISIQMMEEKGIKSQTCILTPGSFSPTCAVLGGLLGQDILNAIGGREEPIVNWFILDGQNGEWIPLNFGRAAFRRVSDITSQPLITTRSKKGQGPVHSVGPDVSVVVPAVSQ
ncbi:hypothetical protein IE53DRAFT_317189, partial [Violaceomyces palustris]